MALGIGVLALFVGIGLLPIRGWKGFGIKAVILVALGAAIFIIPDMLWISPDGEYTGPDWFISMAIPVPEKLGSFIGGKFLGPIGAILGLPAALIMALVLKPKAS
ncbi:MAG: hypothetical protein AB1758_08435 [Candidatus Eremiobacterota bacterium]